MLELAVKNFGPLRSAKVEIKPLTIFVGPNNSGKSYLAMLLYSLCGAQYSESPVSTFQLRRYWEKKTSKRARTDIDQKVRNWLVEFRQRSPQERHIVFGDLPEPLQDVLEEVGDEYFRRFAVSLSQELRRCFGAEIPDLVSHGQGIAKFSVDFSQSELPWSVSAVSEKANLHVNRVMLSYAKQNFNIRPLLRELDQEGRQQIPDRMVYQAISQLSRTLNNSLPRAYYLPAARSGILQSHKALASVIIRQAPLAGLRRLDVPQVSGVIADFISELLLADEESLYGEVFDEREPDEKVARIGEELEERVLSGSVVLEKKVSGYPEIYYQVGKYRFPLYRTSSMVSEVAPVALLLKEKVSPGDLLIIEEPESHLHPANQLKFARAVVALVRCKVNVLLTTHSDYFLSQLGNFVRLGEKTQEDRKQLGFGKGEFLDASEVSGYLIQPGSRGLGSSAVPLKIDSSVGISETVFANVAESLYEETWKIAEQ
jgi:predicted ATPase